MTTFNISNEAKISLLESVTSLLELHGMDIDAALDTGYHHMTMAHTITKLEDVISEVYGHRVSLVAQLPQRK